MFVLWTISIARLLYDATQLPYLHNSSTVEYVYFCSLYVLAWHHFEINNIFGYYDEPSVFFQLLESQFVDKFGNTDNSNNGNTQHFYHIDTTDDMHNTYGFDTTKKSEKFGDVIEWDANDINFEYSYSNMIHTINTFDKPLVLRNFIPIPNNGSIRQTVDELFNQFGEFNVPMAINPDKLSTRFKHKMNIHEYSKFPDAVLKDVNNITMGNGYNMVKYWHICEAQNNTKLWDMYGIDKLEIPKENIAATGLFASNVSINRDPQTSS